MVGSTITLLKELLVLEDIETGAGTVTQSRGVGTRINASNLSFNGTISIAAAIALKADTTALTAGLLLKADTNGNALNAFSVLTASGNSHAVPLLQMNNALALKFDVTAATLKADKSNVLELNNSTAFIPTSPYQPATKKYVDDALFNTGAADMRKAIYDVDASGIVDTAEGVGVPATFMGVTPHGQVMRVGQTLITDCNTITDMGIFKGTNVANAPANGEILLEQWLSSTGKYQVCFAAATNIEYVRAYNGVSWSLWGKELTDADIVNDLLGSSSPYAVLSAAQGLVISNALSLKANTATTIQKDSDTGAAAMPYGTTAQRPVAPAVGYMRFNTDLGKAEVWNGTLWAAVGAGATGGGADTVFVETSYTVTQNYTITAGKSAMTVGNSNGDVVINDGVIVTIPDASQWTILGA